MNEWTVVTSLSVIVALAAAVGGPIVKLNGTISRLSVILEQVLQRLDKLEQEDQRLRERGERSEELFGSRMDGQDKRLNRCENRISLLEQRGGVRYDNH